MAQASGRGFPVRSLVYGRLVDGKPTDFVWNLYQDHLLLIVTQLGSIGTVIAATQDASAEEAQQESGGVTYSTSVLLGKRDEPGLGLCARQIVQFVGSQGHAKPVTLCLALKDHGLATVRDVVAAIKEEHVWA